MMLSNPRLIYIEKPQYLHTCMQKYFGKKFSHIYEYIHTCNTNLVSKSDFFLIP